MTATVTNSTASVSSTGGGGGGTNGGAVTQSFALSNTWSFNHNLNTHYPVVTVYNENKEVIIPTNIVSKTNNQIEILFSSQASGSVAVVSGFNTGSTGGTPGGSNTQIQFNDNGVFGGSPDLVFDKTNDTLRISGSINTTGSIRGQFSAAGTSYDLISVASAVTNVSAVPLGGGTVVGLQSVINAISNQISAISTNITSVNNRISVVSSNATSIGNVVGNVSAVSYTTNTTGTAVTGLQNVVNALSVRSNELTRYVSTANNIANTALTGISGLTISVSAGDLLQLEAMLIYSVGGTVGNGFGLTFPAATNMAGQWIGANSVNQPGPSTVQNTLVIGDFDTGDSNSIIWSAAVGAGLHIIRMHAVYQVSTAGTMFPTARVSSTSTPPTTVIHRGSFFRVLKLN
jgi:hypothetical protein